MSQDNIPSQAPVVIESTEASASPELEISQGAESSQEQVAEEPTQQQQAPKEPSASKRFSQLAKKQRELLKLQEEVKQYEPVREAASKAKENPLAYLQAAGLSVDDILTLVIQEGEEAKPETTEDKLAKLEAKIKEKEELELRHQQEQQYKAAEEKINTFKNNINSFLETNSEKYELTTLLKQNDLVYDVIYSHWEKTKQLIPIDKAAETVEQYLYTTASPLAKSTKLVGKQSQVPKEQAVKGDNNDSSGFSEIIKAKKMQALSNNIMVTRSSQENTNKQLSPEEKKRLLAEKYKL